MPQEIERKFILSKIPKNLPALKIKQGYLQLDKNCTIRVRSTISSTGTKDTLTIKGPTSTSGMSRYEYETELIQYDYNQMIKDNDIKIYGDFSNRTSIISFNIDGIHFNDLAMFLDKKNIAIRTGHHCAQPFMKHFNISGNARMSVGVYNTKDDIDFFIKTIDEVKEILKS